LHNWQVPRLFALRDAADIDTSFGSETEKAASSDVIASDTDRRDPLEDPLLLCRIDRLKPTGAVVVKNVLTVQPLHCRDSLAELALNDGGYTTKI
jgi:hypothetical protein